MVQHKNNKKNQNASVKKSKGKNDKGKKDNSKAANKQQKAKPQSAEELDAALMKYMGVSAQKDALEDQLNSYFNNKDETNA